LKGFLAVKLGSLIATHFLLSSVLGSVIAAIACILGHNYTIWLSFKGGKGIATSGGAVLALLPPLVFVSVGVVWIALPHEWYRKWSLVDVTDSSRGEEFHCR
jgi:glycerol-3-phosphate acyltransferase PlsY